MAKLSAGLLLYRRGDDAVELLIAHPGGPIWQRRDRGAWGLPKGAANDGEDLLDAARREFEEELGHPPPGGPALDLGEVRLRSGKIVHGWAVEGDFDPDSLYSMLAELVWPPRSGKVIRVPEIDRVMWAPPAEARRRMHPAQAAFVDRLLERLGAAGAGEAGPHPGTPPGPSAGTPSREPEGDGPGADRREASRS